MFFSFLKREQNRRVPPPKKKTKRKRVQGKVRWPFGPPHLTLKPKKTKTNKKRITKKERDFQLSIKMFCILGSVSKRIFENLAQKRATPKSPQSTIK